MPRVGCFLRPSVTANARFGATRPVWHRSQLASLTQSVSEMRYLFMDASFFWTLRAASVCGSKLCRASASSLLYVSAFSRFSGRSKCVGRVATGHSGMGTRFHRRCNPLSQKFYTHQAQISVSFIRRLHPKFRQDISRCHLIHALIQR